MNLIFVITKNEIRPFRSNDGKTVSVFHISGEEIYEYDECYDFAEDLKDKLLSILNMRDFSEVAVDIAYIKGEKCAAEEILKEFIPCLRVQAVEFDKIDNAAEVAEKMLCITENKSVALEKELGNTKKSLAEAEQRIAEMEEQLNEYIEANNSFDIEYTALQKEHDILEAKCQKYKKKLDNQYAKERFCCRLKFEHSNPNTVDIDWNYSNGYIFEGKCPVDMNNYIEGHFNRLGKCNVFTPTGKKASTYIDTDYKMNNVYRNIGARLYCYGCNDASIEIAMPKGLKRKLLILKSKGIAENEIFAVITHPEDPIEAVREWVKVKEG